LALSDFSSYLKVPISPLRRNGAVPREAGMDKSKRIVIQFVVVEVLLAAIMIFLIAQVKIGTIQTTISSEETIGQIGTSIGGVMGALGGFLLVFAWVLRRRGE
jgi:uncharacterized protein (TIGR03382 family)